MSNPQTAIIVLSYNGLNVTKKFLKHLYDNTENFTLIMIDNGSTDGTKEYLTNFFSKKDNVVFSASDKNLYIIGGRNHGFNIYESLPDKPEYFMFLDNDQFVQSGWLEHHHEVMKQSHAHLVGVEAWLLNRNFRPVRKCKGPREPWSYVGCGGMLINKEVTDVIGMFDPRFNPFYFEDPDYCIRAVDKDFKLAWNYKAKLIHIPHQTLGKNPKRMRAFQNSHQKFCEKWKKKRITVHVQPRIPALS